MEDANEDETCRYSIDHTYDRMERLERLEKLRIRRNQRREFIRAYHAHQKILDEKKLRRYASLNDVENLSELLEYGVNPNAADENGRTALHLASSRGYTDIVQSLLAHKARVNVVDKLGNTPLHLAVCTTSTATVNLLLKAGCSVSAKGKNGCTPLQLAQSKLWLLQRHTCQEYNTLKSQVSELIDLMKKLVKNESQEAQIVDAFSTRLNLSQTADEVNDDIKQLLENLDSLHINKPILEPSKFSLQDSSPVEDVNEPIDLANSINELISLKSELKIEN